MPQGTINGRLMLPERTTPIALASHVQVYSKTDNLIYFQSGAGVEYVVDMKATETVTTGSPALTVGGATQLDSSGGAITGTLGSGEYIGQIKVIVMTEASTSSTISVTLHSTSDPEVGTFAAVDEAWILQWSGTEWITLYASCSGLVTLFTSAALVSLGDMAIQTSSPEYILRNTTEEDADDGRESSLRFKGEQSGGETTTLVLMRGSHDGAVDDEKGKIEFLVNDGNDADAPTLRTTIGSDGSLKHGDGGTTDYISFAIDGTATLFGTAMVTKHLRFPGASFGFGGSAPAAVPVGNFSAWSYDIGDDSEISFDLPDDWATGTDMTIKVDWGINRDEATENAEVQWNATWSAVPHDATEVLTGAGTTVDPGDQSIPTNANTLTRTTLGTIAGASLAVGDEIGIKFERVALDGGADPGAAVDPYITHLHIEYTADKLGE